MTSGVDIGEQKNGIDLVVLSNGSDSHPPAGIEETVLRP